jgi:hypothetical protein
VAVELEKKSVAVLSIYLIWFRIAAGPSLKPEAYGCMSRIRNEAPIPPKAGGQKTFLRGVLMENREVKPN